MITRIKIKGYKSLIDADIQLQPFSVLVGPNEAGKSNFLDALQLLSRITSVRTLKQAFEPPNRGNPLESFSFGQEGIKGLLKKDRVALSFEADIKLSDTLIDSVHQQIRIMKSPAKKNENELNHADSKKLETYLRYRIEIEILPQSGFLRLTDEYLAPLKHNGEIKTSRNPFIEKVGDCIHVRIESQAHPTYYPLHLDHSILSLPFFTPHYPHIAALQKEFLSWHFHFFEPRERMRASSPVKEVRYIGYMGEELSSFLNTLKVSNPGQFHALEKELNLIVPSVTGIEVSVNDHGEVELHLSEGQKPIPLGIVSEGTLRVLGLLAMWGVKEPPSLVGIEEPENGINPRRIKLIAELLKNKISTGKTQLIAATHSTILTDLIPDENLYICRKREGKTLLEHFSAWGSLSRKAVYEKALDEEEGIGASSGRIMQDDAE